MDISLTHADTVRAYIFQQFPLARQRHVGDDDSLVEGGIVDSLGVLEIVNFLETRFGLQLDDDDIVSDNFHSIAALARLVASRASDASSMTGD